jgi:hypothetical protein
VHHPAAVVTAYSSHPKTKKQQTFEVWQPCRAAMSKRPNTPSDGTKTNGAKTHPEAEILPTTT